MERDNIENSQPSYLLSETITLYEYVKHYHWISIDFNELIQKENDKEQDNLYEAYIDFVWNRGAYIYKEDYDIMCKNPHIYPRLQKVVDRLITMPEESKKRLVPSKAKYRKIENLFWNIIVTLILLPFIYVIWWIITIPFEAMTGIYVSGRTPTMSAQLLEPSLWDFLFGILGSIFMLAIVLTVVIKLLKI